MNEPVTDFRVLVVEDDPDCEVALRGKSEPIRVYSIRP
jgi:hypothetical protein